VCVNQKCHQILEMSLNRLYGETHLWFKNNKSLVFDNWINSSLIYINDILSEIMEISSF
jgi:hypothetical protein